MVEMEDLSSARMKALNDLADTMEDPAAETLLDIFLAVYETEGAERAGRLNAIADDLAEVFDAPIPRARIYVWGMAGLVEKALVQANRIPEALRGHDALGTEREIHARNEGSPRRRPAGDLLRAKEQRVREHVRRRR